MTIMKPVLQAFLEILDFENAIEAANRAYLSGAEMIGISNFLLKRYGLVLVSKIRSMLPKTRIYVDTKIIDNLEEESKMFYEAGADIISIHSSLNEEFILPSLASVKKLGMEISFDLSGIKNVIDKVLDLSYITPDYFYYKIPTRYLEDSLSLSSIFRIIKELTRIASAPLIVANLKNLQHIVMCNQLGVRIFSLSINLDNFNKIEEVLKEARKSLEISFQ